MKILPFVLCLLAMTAISCDFDVYEITLTPQGDTMVRELAVHRSSQSGPHLATLPASDPTQPAAPAVATQPASQPAPVAPEVLARIEKAYGAPGKVVDGTHVFAGRFKGKMPSDVGGAGTYTTLPTEMGTAFFYLERFRGQEHPGQSLAGMKQSADRLLDLVIGWYEAELGKEKNFPAMKAWLDQDARRMFHDLLAFYHVAAADLQTEKVNEEMAARAAQYVLEHEFLSPAELAGLFGGPNMPLSERGLRKALDLLRAKTTAKLGLDANKPQPALAFLDWDKAGESFKKHVEQTPAYRDYAAEFKKKQATQPAATAPGAASQPAEPTVDEFVGKIVTPLLPHFGTGDDDKLTVALHLPAEPVNTNGKWDKDKKAATWQFGLSGADTTRWPRISYAVWGEPDAAFQKKHFGQTVLNGKELLTYCLTRKGMSAEESAKWMERVEKMTPENTKFAKPGEHTSPLDELNQFLSSPATQPATEPAR